TTNDPLVDPGRPRRARPLGVHQHAGRGARDVPGAARRLRGLRRALLQVPRAEPAARQRHHGRRVLGPLRGADAPPARERDLPGGHPGHPPLPPLLLVHPEEEVTVRRLGSLLLLFAILLAVVVPARAAGIDRNFAGSAQVDYHFVPAENNTSAR